MDCVLANSKTLTNPNNFPEITEVYIRHWLNNLHVWHSTGKLLSNQEAFKPINKIKRAKYVFIPKCRRKIQCELCLRSLL